MGGYGLRATLERLSQQFTASLAQSQRSEQRLLLGDQRLDALPSERHHLCELSVVEYLMLRCGLQFDNFVACGHDEVHVHIGARVFFVIKTEKTFAIHNAYANRRNKILDRRRSQGSRIDQALQSQAQRDECSSD